MEKLLTEQLIEFDPFLKKTEETKAIFKAALIEELTFHYNNNGLYKKFCENKGFIPTDFTGRVEDIPAVSVSVFKELGKNLSSVNKEEIKMTLQSSATSGIPSSVTIDKITARRQAKVMIKVIQEFIGKERKPFLIMDVNPQAENRHLLGARFAAVSGYLNFASEAGYFLKVQENKYYFDTDAILDFITNLNKEKPVVVFGFTYILYSEVLKPNKKNENLFQLPKGSKVIHIGGWKKLENEKVTREVFNQNASKLFGIEESDIIDIYGFTEQMGLNYPDCQCGFKHTSLYSEIIVRDTITKKALPSGNIGMLEFISPIPHSYPGNVVLTDDLGFIDESPCSFGRSGTRFKIIGRLKKAEIRGCGDILANKLTFTSVNLTQNPSTEESFRFEFWKGAKINVSESKEQLLQLIKELERSKDWLRNQPIDALIGLIAKVSLKWSETDNPQIKELREKGLSFLSAWCSPEHLVRISTIGLRGNRLHIDTFLPILESNIQYIKANQRGLVCHWLAGNVQVLGMFALIQSILTKNINLLKISSRDDGVFATLLRAFENTSFTTPGGYTIKGDDLLKTIAVIYFNHADKTLGKIMSESANVRIAWGGKEAIETVSNFSSRIDCEDIIFGPKLSFSVIARDKLMEPRLVKKLARKVAVDVSVFDQTGCASPHNLYIETGGKISPQDFAALLAEGLKKTALQIPKGYVSPEQIAAIHSARGVYDFKGKVWESEDSTWTILYSDETTLNPPIYSRVINIHPIENIEDTLIFIDNDIQTIGLAASGPRALQYAEKAVSKGVMRFPEIGKMLNFESPWDGMFVMDRLVRWSTLGGPIV